MKELDCLLASLRGGDDWDILNTPTLLLSSLFSDAPNDIIGPNFFLELGVCLFLEVLLELKNKIK